jgi:hypothetical protein
VIIELLFASSKGTGIGMAIGGIAAVLVVSAVFYVIGRGEDRDRAASAAARATAPGDEPAQPPEAGESPSAPAGRSRSPRATRRRPRR